MNHIHKNIRLTIIDRENMWKDYCEWKTYKTKYRYKTILAAKYRVSRQTVNKVLKMRRCKELYPKHSTNHRYQNIQYGLKRLAKIESKILTRKNAEARRYNKQYPWELFHMDTKKLPAIQWDTNKSKEYIVVGIDHYSCEWYAQIVDNKTQWSTAQVLQHFVDQCPYSIEKILTDNGKEYKWTNMHQFVQTCEQHSITQAFTKVKRPQTNGKAERFIRTIIDMRHKKEQFSSREQRKQSLKRFLNWYNTVKPHKTLDWLTPYEYLYTFYYEDDINQKQSLV